VLDSSPVQTSSMKLLEKMGGLTQPEFIGIEERKDESGLFSCLTAVRVMQETGRYDDARQELESEMHRAKERGQFEYACICCMISGACRYPRFFF
jgi:hypothetical protein